jgi:hypothetical protein
VAPQRKLDGSVAESSQCGAGVASGAISLQCKEKSLVAVRVAAEVLGKDEILELGA